MFRGLVVGKPNTDFVIAMSSTTIYEVNGDRSTIAFQYFPEI